MHLHQSDKHCAVNRAGKAAPAVICPMRDFPIKDLALLCQHEGTPYAGLLVPPPGVRDRPSINRLAENFVAGLQVSLPSTVPTILRTASKLQASAPLAVSCSRGMFVHLCEDGDLTHGSLAQKSVGRQHAKQQFDHLHMWSEFHLQYF